MSSRLFRPLEVGRLPLFVLGGGRGRLAGDRDAGLVLHLTVIVQRRGQGHLVDQGGDVLHLRQLARPAAAVAGDELVLTILPQTEHHRLLHAARLDAGDEAAVAFVRLSADRRTGQVMDFGQRDGSGLGGRDLAGFVCH